MIRKIMARFFAVAILFSSIFTVNAADKQLDKLKADGKVAVHG